MRPTPIPAQPNNCWWPAAQGIWYPFWASGTCQHGLSCQGFLSGTVASTRHCPCLDWKHISRLLCL